MTPFQSVDNSQSRSVPSTIDQQYGDRAIAEAAIEPLEKWPNQTENAYTIHLEHPEFTALCPRSGYPDFGTIVVDYQPKDWVVELKAFKLYINAFRDQRISHGLVHGPGDCVFLVRPVEADNLHAAFAGNVYFCHLLYPLNQPAAASAAKSEPA